MAEARIDTLQESDLDSLSSLEDRVLRAVETVGALKRENAALVERLQSAEQEAGRLSRELEAAKSDQRKVRERIEKLLSQIDAISGA
jgi:FtsZ-binding cell division protein ZapB